MNLGARPRGVGFPCTTAGSVVSAQDAYYGDIVAERELTCGCQSLEKEFAFASTGANAPGLFKLFQTVTGGLSPPQGGVLSAGEGNQIRH